jgi:ArsR family transcriptional regulator, arsenate/arsenite/antimonite-responsive transcriptional repressor
MKAMDPARAEEYARWFACLADGTRIRVLHAVAVAERPLTVGEVVDAVGRSQSTVSRHLRLLADEGYVFLEADGVRTLVTVNEACMVDLPAAAAEIMATSRPDRRS